MPLYNQVVDERIALDIVRQATKADEVAIDTETNGKEIRDGRGHAYGASIAFGDTAVYLPFRHRDIRESNYDLHNFMQPLQDIINNSTVIYHNAKFDLVSLRTLGLDTLGKRFVDTMVLAHLVDENRPFAGKSLDACSKFYLHNTGKKNEKDTEYSTALAMFGYEGMTADLTAEYAAWDARITFDLYQKLVPKLKAENLGPTWKHKSKMIELLIDMEGAGVGVDVDLCERMSGTAHYEMLRIRQDLGFLNPGSTQDLKTLLIDQLKLPVVKLTPKGKPCFDKWAMEEYEEILEVTDDPTAKRILEYRGWQKSVTSNYEPYVKLLSPDGRLRCNYNLHRTVTGRMSCNEPNLQQIPRLGEKPWNGKMKQCFKAKPGYVLLEGDYSQLEFRLSSSFAKETALLEIFNSSDRDVFTELAKALGMGRQDAKTLTYSILYGAGAKRISNIFGVSLSKGQQIRDNFFRVYPNLLRASKYATHYAKSHKYVPLWSGRRRHFLDPEKDAHKAYNSLTQGGAADIVERTMIRSDEEGFNTEDCKMLLQVHDSIVWEVREDLVDKLKPELADMMRRVTPDFGVNFKAEIKVWGA